MMYLDSPISPATTSAISAAILSASPVTRLGLASPDDRLRERAAQDLADAIVARLEVEAGQLTLSL